MPPRPPPAIRTLPFFSKVAVWPSRGTRIGAMALKPPVSGSYTSADAVVAIPLGLPPAMSTRPSRSRVAVCPSRGVVIAPIARKLPDTGS